MKIKFAALVLCLLFLVSVFAEEKIKIVAMVNNQVITSKDLEDYCNALAYRLSGGGSEFICGKEEMKESLGRLIQDKLILSEAEKEKIELSDQVIENRVTQTISSFSSRDAFEKSLVNRGLTVSLLKEKIKEQYLMRGVIDKKIKSQVNISPQEISSHYEANRDKFNSPLTYLFFIASSKDESNLKDIGNFIDKEGVVKANEKYKSVLKRIESNKDELKQDLIDILEQLEKDKFGIKQTQDAFLLVYLENKIAPAKLSLLDVKEDIYNYLYDIKFRKLFSEWSKELEKRAVIKKFYGE